LERIRECGVAAAVAGSVTLLVVWLAGGAIGPGRMSALGPSLWQVPLIVAAEVGVLSAIVVAGWEWVGLIRELLADSAARESG
jgi:hypothetical protein